MFSVFSVRTCAKAATAKKAQVQMSATVERMACSSGSGFRLRHGFGGQESRTLRTRCAGSVPPCLCDPFHQAGHEGPPYFRKNRSFHSFSHLSFSSSAVAGSIVVNVKLFSSLLTRLLAGTRPIDSKSL